MTMARAILAAAGQPVAVPMQVAIEAALVEFGITSKNQVAGFLGQCAHESGGFTKTAESLNYSAEALIANFSRDRISVADARKYGRAPNQAADQRAIGNSIYGGAWGLRALGNTQPEDGWTFRGAGLMHTTGRRNAERAVQGLKWNGTPEALMQAMRTDPWLAARGGVFWWVDNGCGPLAEAADWVGLSKLINLGSATSKGVPNGLPDRLARINRVLAVL